MELIVTNRKGERFTALYDECDQHIINANKWCVSGNRLLGRHDMDGQKKLVRFYRVVLGLTDPKDVVDHINHNELDNRRRNLRVCTQAENSRNKLPRGKVPYLGVSPYIDPRQTQPRPPKYVVFIKVNGKNKNIGYFSTPEAAARAYDDAAKIHHGEFANLNFPNE